MDARTFGARLLYVPTCESKNILRTGVGRRLRFRPQGSPGRGAWRRLVSTRAKPQAPAGTSATPPKGTASWLEGARRSRKPMHGAGKREGPASGGPKKKKKILQPI